MVSEDEKIRTLQRFKEETSSANLREFVCASWNGSVSIKHRSEVDIDDIDLELLRCPDCQAVGG